MGYGEDIGGGALSGATTGAAIGSVVPGIGTGIGAGAGALVGGGIGYLRARNAKKQAEQRAREDAARKAQQDALYAPAAQNAASVYAQMAARAQDPNVIGRVDPAADALRGQQYGALATAQNAANGQGPSAATAQYQAGVLDSQRRTMGMANAASGADRAAMRMQAMAGFGEMAGQHTAQAAALKAQEQQQAVANYQQMLAQSRSQDQAYANLQLQRDQAADAAARGAMGLANDAVGTQANLAASQAGAQNTAQQQAYQNAVEENKRRREADAAMRQSVEATATKLYTSYNQGKQGTSVNQQGRG